MRPVLALPMAVHINYVKFAAEYLLQTAAYVCQKNQILLR